MAMATEVFSLPLQVDPCKVFFLCTKAPAEYSYADNWFFFFNPLSNQIQSFLAFFSGICCGVFFLGLIDFSFFFLVKSHKRHLRMADSSWIIFIRDATTLSSNHSQSKAVKPNIQHVQNRVQDVFMWETSFWPLLVHFLIYIVCFY